MILKHSNGDINQSVQHEPTHDSNNGWFQNLCRSSLLWLLTAGYNSTPLQHQMTSPVTSVTNIPLPVDTGAINLTIDPAIDPATSLWMGSIMYDWNKNCYNLEWESRDNFDRWLTNEQDTHGIEIQISKVQHSKQLYLSSKTFRCTCNRTGGVKHYEKKTTQERKIESKWIEGGCPCYIQIKTYPHTQTILGKYNCNHSHCYVHTCQDCIRIGKFSFLIYDGMRS